jgi:hypothetical protein
MKAHIHTSHNFPNAASSILESVTKKYAHPAAMRDAKEEGEEEEWFSSILLIISLRSRGRAFVNSHKYFSFCGHLFLKT